jgi:hypothetical protein
MTWLNAINDQGIGRGAKVVSGTIRDSLHMVDVIFGLYWATLFTDVDLPISRVEAKASRGYG